MLKKNQFNLTGKTKISLTQIFLSLSLMIFLFLVNCNNSYAKLSHEKYALQKIFKDKFLIGAAVGYHQIVRNDKHEIALIEKHFNTITPENCMKWQVIHPEPGVYNFKQADRFVEFGEKNNMFIVGHILLDQVMVPDWVFQNADGNTTDRETLLMRIKEHIHTVVGHYKGRIHAWHVINEAIGSDGKYRKSKWLDIIGEDHIEKAFEYAHQADPNVELHYNGHDMLTEEATNSIIRLIKNIKSQGGRIDGVGVQAHWKLHTPSAKVVEDSIVKLAASGVKMMITEMDITVLPRNAEMYDNLNPYPDGLPVEMQEKLAKRYGELFSVFCKHADKLHVVNFWGVHDKQSWLNDWPIRGRTDYPLLFGRNLQPKPAFFAVVKTVIR